jgi:hypothetical protein
MKKIFESFNEVIKENKINSYYKVDVRTVVVEDSYEDGEGKIIKHFSEVFTNEKLEALLKDVAEYVYYKDYQDFNFNNINEYEWASELWADTLIDSKNNYVGVGSKLYEKWKNGEVKLYTQKHHIIISKVSEFPIEDELKKIKFKG